MDREIVTAARLLDLMNAGLRRGPDACRVCCFDGVRPLSVPDGRGTNWETASLRCAPESARCEALADRILGAAKEAYNLDLSPGV